MPQRHMPLPLFRDILSRMPLGQHTVSLQGEGEPLTHPKFWEMASLVEQRGYIPYTITNGSKIDPERMGLHFPRIGVSLDTLDADEAHRIGRYKLPIVLKNLKILFESYGAHRVIIHTVDYGQDIQAIKNFATTHGVVRHIIQALQRKDDYAYRYRDLVLPSTDTAHYTYRCRYIDTKRMRNYNIDGIEMPCCFIKDTSRFVSITHIKDALVNRSIPDCCRGCREITTPGQLSRHSV